MRKRHKKKISRKKGFNEPEIDIKHQNEVNVLAAQFKEDQLKIVLRRCLNNVQKYGPEAIMKAVEDSWTAMAAVGCHAITQSSSVDENALLKVEIEVADEHMKENLEEVETSPAYGTAHDHEETSKRNALFLIESSQHIDYDSETLANMKRAYEKGSYDDVADLAYLYDRSRRPLAQPPESRVNDETTLCREEPESPWKRVSELLTEVAEESSESPLKCCVEAVRHLSRDLTYDNRVAAKDSIRKAIQHLEE